MANYNRKCRDCGRWINIRQMPHGKWVAFEGEEPHKCDDPPASKITRSKSMSAEPTGKAPEPFAPYYRTVETEGKTREPDVIRQFIAPKPSATPDYEPTRQSPSNGLGPTLKWILFFIVAGLLIKALMLAGRHPH